MSSIQEVDFDFESLHMLRYWSKEELVAYISKLMNWLIDCVQKTHLLVSFRIIIKDENFLFFVNVRNADNNYFIRSR